MGNKRARGRPRTVRAKPAHRKTRLRGDGKPVKPLVRASDREVEAWLEQHGPSYWVGRGRPPEGQQSLVVAVMARFDVSRQTVVRLLVRIKRRRLKALHDLPVDPAQAGLLAALASRYRNNVPLASDKNVPDKINITQSTSSTEVTHKKPGVKADYLPPAIGLADLRGIILRAVYEWTEDSLLHELKSHLEARLPPPSSTQAYTPARTRGLDAVGLRTVTGSNSFHVKGIQDPTQIARSSLIESLEVYEATAKEPDQVVRAMRSLRDYLVKRASGGG